jgi:hypothetical protein
MKKLMYADRTEAFQQEDKRTLDWLDRSVIPAYSKIADSCLGILDGDHYYVCSNGMTSGEYIAKRLKVPYLGERSAWINIVFVMGTANNEKDNLSYAIHIRHGKGGNSTEGGDVNSLIKQETKFFADLHLGAHTHKNNCHTERVEYITNKGHIKDKIVTYMRGGSFLDGFPANGHKTYAYRKEYSPLPVGWGEVELTMGRNWIGRLGSRPFGIRMVKASVISAC